MGASTVYNSYGSPWGACLDSGRKKLEEKWVRYNDMMSSNPPAWENESACLGGPPELFELGDPKEIDLDDQHELIAEGLKICSTCPVRSACEADATELDKYWTTRGGKPPEGLFQDSKRPSLPSASEHSSLVADLKLTAARFNTRQDVCQFGHDNWRERTDKRKGRECVTCKKARDLKSLKARRQRAKAS